MNESTDFKSLARTLTIVENGLPGYETILHGLKINSKVPIIGFTGAPGAGKSSIINLLANHFVQQGKRLAIIAVDPTSPFHHGSLLGDRLRMTSLVDQKNVFIRSLATRGSLGGLSEKVKEITDVLRSDGFDMIFVETVGVGQSETKITTLADITIVVFVPESGDDIQAMKSGIMEIADIFVVNKSDREGADRVAGHLLNFRSRKNAVVPVVKTSVFQNTGIEDLANHIMDKLKSAKGRTHLGED